MEQKLNSIASKIIDLKQRSKQLADEIKSLEPGEMGIKIYVSRIAKMSLQSLDVLSGMGRQLSFLSNEYRNKRDNDRRREHFENKRKRRT